MKIPLSMGFLLIRFNVEYKAFILSESLNDEKTASRKVHWIVDNGFRLPFVQLLMFSLKMRINDYFLLGFGARSNSEKKLSIYLRIQDIIYLIGDNKIPD